MKDKEMLFKVTKEDLDIQFFRSGGPGGQKQNKTSSACRVVHRESGAVGESRDERSQDQNRKIAFRRMAESKTFQSWVQLKAAAIQQGYRDLEHKLDELMKEENLIIETYDPKND